MSDNCSAYQSSAFRDLLAERGIKRKVSALTRRTPTARPSASSRPACASGRIPGRSKPPPDRAVAMQPWLSDYNSCRPHSALGGQFPLIRLAQLKAQTAAPPTDTSDTEPRFAGVAGVKPHEATAEGGVGLTLVTPAQAQSAIAGNFTLCGAGALPPPAPAVDPER
jgi:hypothetical protein